MWRNALRTLFLFAVAGSWTKLVEWMVRKKLVSVEISRKAIHVGIGVLYILCWAIYPPSCEVCRYLAALVPLSVIIKFMLIVLGWIHDPITVEMLCRNGNRNQLLLGPLIYGAVIVFATVFFWLDSLDGLIMITILCVGDGMAAIGGKAMPLAPLPWNKNKSVGGSLTFSLCSLLAMISFMALFQSMGYEFEKISFVPLFCIISSSAFVESLPLGEFDNFLVPAFALLISKAISHNM